MHRLEKLFEPDPRLLDCRHVVPLANFQPKISRTVNDHLGDSHGLVLRVGGSGDVRELEKFFEGGKYGREWVSRVVCCLLDYVLALKEFMWYQLTVVFLEVSDNASHIVVGVMFCGIEDILEICLFNCGNYL